MYIIGLTGNIGTGKSTVLHMLEQLGARVIDADRLAHETMTKGSPVWQAIVDEFGEEVLSPEGEIDRQRLGSIAFGDPAALRRLEAIVHPAVKARVAELLARMTAEGDAPARGSTLEATGATDKRAGASVVVIEAIKLVEAGMHKQADALWVVTCKPEQQVARLVAQRRLSEDEVRRRMAAQPPVETKLALADVVIDNSGTPEETWEQVKAAWDRIPRSKNANPRRFQAIFFDAWHTLFTVRAERLERLQHALAGLGLHPPREQLASAMASAESQLRSQDRPWIRTLEAERLLFLEYYRLLFTALGMPDPEAWADRLDRGYSYVPWTVLYPDARPVLETLKERGYSLGIISNAYPSLLEALDYLDITRYFDNLTISAFIGVEKPDPRIYQRALAETGVAPQAALFVDDQEENVMAAIELGMTALLIDRSDDQDPSCCRRIRSLTEILDLV